MARGALRGLAMAALVYGASAWVDANHDGIRESEEEKYIAEPSDLQLEEEFAQAGAMPWWYTWGAGDSTSPTPSPKYVASEKMTALQMEFEMKMCDMECDSFENDPGVIVNTDGRFRSVGERAMAFALAANVEGIYPGDKLHSVNYVAVESAKQEKAGNEDRRYPRLNDAKDKVEVCDARVKVFAQVDFDKVGLYPEFGQPLTMNNPKVAAFANQLARDVTDAASSGALKASLGEIWYGVESFCEAPHDFAFTTMIADRPSSIHIAHEYERCKTMAQRGGYEAMDGKCRREITAFAVMSFFCLLLMGLGCIQVFSCFRCTEGAARLKGGGSRSGPSWKHYDRARDDDDDGY
eukprot:CAMPEP_0172644044 /NCGR_PEP_ID=MMETSP1068-20121228/239007_1 /TAXON_ID=35684 /ORGANISM="Pseudopedinella elastica, Strain CCMP716" /LENGTH=350 /DNA_ID=CAMNT_0013458227 /DNA_START=25 /DNA_END=1077 /DNA_ORIENTATION=+